MNGITPSRIVWKMEFMRYIHICTNMVMEIMTRCFLLKKRYEKKLNTLEEVERDKSPVIMTGK